MKHNEIMPGTICARSNCHHSVEQHDGDGCQNRERVKQGGFLRCQCERFLIDDRPAVKDEPTEQPTINPDAPRPGPWRVGLPERGEYEWVIYDGDGCEIIDCARQITNRQPDAWKAIARRVAAALNYCAGISTEALERPANRAVDPAAVVARITQRHQAEVLEAYEAGARRGQAACEATHQCEVCEDRQRATDAVTASALRLDSSPLAAPESDFDSEKVGQHGLEDKNAVQGKYRAIADRSLKWVMAERAREIASRIAVGDQVRDDLGRLGTALPSDVLPLGNPPIGTESVEYSITGLHERINRLRDRTVDLEATNANLTQQMSSVLGRLDLIEQKLADRAQIDAEERGW